MRISIIIPNYNGEELLKKNLPAVFDSAKYFESKNKENVEVIVIDDASTDQSRDFLKSQNVALIENKKNLGFAKSVNKAVEHARGEIIILLNSDVSPQNDFLFPLIVHFKDENVFAVGCMDKSIENGKTILRGRGLGKWKKGFLIHNRGEVNKTNTLWVSGGSGAFKKSIWEKLGGFNPLYYPFYWEDIDLSYRGLKAGYTILFEPKSIVIHEHEKGSIKKKYSHFEIKTISYKNQFTFVWINITDLSFQFQHVFWLPYHFIKAIIHRDFAFFLGFSKALFLLPKIAQSSFRIQKLFVKSDREVIEKLGK